VLSDPTERAWYDSHKTEILTGHKETGIDLWDYFSYSAYPGGFTDEPDGFYTVYRELFNKINLSENAEAEEKTDIFNRPEFGDSTSPIELVKDFYEYWIDFVSKRTFAYADLYNPNEFDTRYARRIVASENKKERDKTRKDFMK
jgi:DnaJ family protein A protein 5